MEMQKYPIGLQDFGGIRNNGYVYIDKTRYLHQLMSSYKYYFLSRPRRFGKSLLISTMECVFKGQKELFEGLYIYDKWAFDEYPIIRISFSNIGYRTMGLQKAIGTTLKEISKHNGIILESDPSDIANMFKELIHSLYTKYNKQVVILIDEYDKPIIDYLDKESIHLAHENRGVMKTFYSILKDADPYLKLVFITGVSKFSQVSIFSDLNNLRDITMLREYNELCGISQNELEHYFTQELKVYDNDKIRLWYNGYTWHVKGNRVYNPFSLLNFFASGDFQNYWYATGTPTFLMELSKKQHFYNFENTVSSGIDLGSFNIDNILLVPVLFQTGYLTITGYDELFGNYTLSFPNMEVEEAYLQRLADTYIENQKSPAKWILVELNASLKSKDHTRLSNAINEAFSHIPYPLWEREHENFYHAIIHLLFSLMGVYIHSEVLTKDGRADAIILYEGHVYCLEFKLNKTAESAIQQVKEMGYLDAYRNKASHFHIIGINFDSEKRKVDGLIWEEV
ncbi:MAG: AAA family ATPase [Saprospiraceae bacterium]|nr:AAA family ATPase [Saprospiraceae bacterium]